MRAVHARISRRPSDGRGPRPSARARKGRHRLHARLFPGRRRPGLQPARSRGTHRRRGRGARLRALRHVSRHGCRRRPHADVSRPWDARPPESSRELLGGAAPSSLRLPELASTELHIDWRQARRWGIAEREVPAGSRLALPGADVLAGAPDRRDRRHRHLSRSGRADRRPARRTAIAAPDGSRAGGEQRAHDARRPSGGALDVGLGRDAAIGSGRPNRRAPGRAGSVRLSRPCIPRIAKRSSTPCVGPSPTERIWTSSTAASGPMAKCAGSSRGAARMAEGTASGCSA